MEILTITKKIPLAGADLQSVPSQLLHYLFNNQPFLTIISSLFLNVVWNIHTGTDYKSAPAAMRVLIA